MQGLITCVLILGLVSPCLCLRWIDVGVTDTVNNVLQYGARGDGESNDSQAFLSAWESTCGAEGAATLIVPPWKTFLVTNLSLAGPCKATSIHIQIPGTIVAPSQAAWGTDKSKWIVISNVNGLTIDGGGNIDGNGATWWQCRSCSRPFALRFEGCNDLTVSGLSVTNSPGAHIAINGCNGATFSNMKVLSPSDSPNTDGFDIAGSTNISIQDSVIATGDDCIAINGGSSYIKATRLTCGPGHGISVGSLGKNGANDTVEEVYVYNCTFTGTSNGARIKTWPGGSGYARKITYDQIILVDAKNPIIIDQYYGALQATANSAVQVSDVTYRGFTGTSATAKAINLDCSSLGCFDLVFDQINIVSSQPKVNTFSSCQNAHGQATSVVPSLSCLST